MRRALALAVLVSTPALAVYQCGDTKDDCQCAASNPYPCCSNGGNCTWYAWEAACCAWAQGLPSWGNANQWGGNARANASYAVESFPVTNAVSNRDLGQYGHVAFTEAVSGSNVTVHEQNCWGNYGMDTHTYAASFFSGGFIVRAGQVECHPGDSQSQSCGNCGTQSRGCGEDGKWGGWGGCSSQGECAPGATDDQACGSCGSRARSCSASCSWGAFSTCEGAAPLTDAGLATTCDTGVPGACGRGELECVHGDLRCAQTVFPRREVCGDGLDNDCDGVTDGPSNCPQSAASSNPSSPRIVLLGGCSVGGSWLFSLLGVAVLLRRRQ